MKKTIGLIVTLLFAFFAGIHSIEAQPRIIEKTIETDSDAHIQLNLKFGESIVVKGWEKDEVSFRAVVEINGGKLNDAFTANFIENGPGIRIETDFDKEKLQDGRADDCPDQRYRSYSWNQNGENQIVCSSITFEIQIPRNSQLVLETIAADVELLNLDGPVDAKSISGFVDLSWPGMNGADISLKTITGEAYSDLDNLTFRNRKEPFPHVGYELRGTIGNGGTLIRLESVSGDLYLRKIGR
tara:strand:+ start:15005 stop:15730 length:726 start_codon:yes stop_codon:yes gene_type:complete